MKIETRCPFSGEQCALANTLSPVHDVLSSTVGGVTIVDLHLGGRTRLVDLSKGYVCPQRGLEGAVSIGDRVPVSTTAMGVAIHIGPTATTPCIELHPW